MSRRQNKWLELGYTLEQIENHLSFERYKAKQSRERRKRNNEKNKELIEKIKKDLMGKTFERGKTKIKVMSINPTIDGKGFWVHQHKRFPDNSGGFFRNFCYFDEYNKDDLEALLT